MKKQYNVVVLMGLGIANADKSLKTINKENIKIIYLNDIT